jgi:hypothetical protein
MHLFDFVEKQLESRSFGKNAIRQGECGSMVQIQDWLRRRRRLSYATGASRVCPYVHGDINF